MGRYYEIALTPAPAPGSKNASATPTKVWSSYPGGVYDPGALQVQFDMSTSVFALPTSPDVGASTITIEGVALADLQQSSQFVGMQISVKGGMGPQGLPLANPNQSGLLMQGLVYQAFGNWVDSDQNINFVVYASKYTFAQPGNFFFSWLPGQSLASALQTCLETAYPNTPVVIKIGSQYATTAPVTWYHHTLKQVAQWLRSYTKKDSRSGNGVDIHGPDQGVIYVSDGSVAPAPVPIVFTDFIGQPKWTNSNVMTFTTVMRADIQVGTRVTMPSGLPTSPGTITTGFLQPSQTLGANQASRDKYKTTFQGKFVINAVRHVGNSREADATSWVSIFQAAALGS